MNKAVENLLNYIKKYSPENFEKFVLEFLLKIENGQYGEVTGKTGDEGIDGFVRLDNLGLSKVYFQAKRWDSTIVGRPEVQKFVGALHGKKATHGIFVTTASFTKEAQDYSKNIGTTVRLIDGEEIVKLLLENDLEDLIKKDSGIPESARLETNSKNEIILSKNGNRLMGDEAKRLYANRFLENLQEADSDRLESLWNYPAERKFLIFDINGNFKVELKNRKDVDEVIDESMIVVYRIQSMEDAPLGSEKPPENSQDELYDDAVEVVVRAKQASTSLLQRRLKVGYSRAARLLDDMEMRGVVGPADGNKPRKILIQTPGGPGPYEDADESSLEE